MSARSPFWTRLTWLLTLAALLSGGAWIGTGKVACGVLSALLGAGACAAAWFGADELADDMGDAGPHPVDPYPESLRHQLALGQMASRRPGPPPEPDDDERTEQGW